MTPFFYRQGDPGEDGVPGKPGTAAVRCQHITVTVTVTFLFNIVHFC